MFKAALQLVQAELRVIANAGVYYQWQSDALLASGVFAVGLGSTLWQVNLNEFFPNL
jgi:2-keto-3-deoxy-6-phosphogluconate aldolase